MKTAKELELSLLLKESHIQQLKLKINKLEQEIERLNKELNKYRFRPSSKINFDKLMSARKEIKRLTAESTEWKSKFYNEAKKVDKAIEYIEQNEWYTKLRKTFINDLLDILKGEDNV